MIRIHLEQHDNYYGLTDVLRLFYDHPVEDKENGQVYCDVDTDMNLKSWIAEDGATYVTDLDTGKVYGFDGEPLDIKRDVKRSLYIALAEKTGRTVPWGCLTGIRPTLVAMEEDTPKELAEKYLVREDKAELSFETGKREQEILDGINFDDINIYIGIPFCPSRCEYCSFISQDIGSHMDRLKNYLDALLCEIKNTAPCIKRHIHSVYIGGGTPTVFDDEDFKKFIEGVYEYLPIDDKTEVTVEAGRPDTITRFKLEVLRQHNVDRLCINPQTMRTETLKKLNRKHSAEDAVETLKMARELGFDNINMDLIAGLKYETSDDFVESVKKVIELRPENITVHTLYKKRKANMSHDDVMDRGNTRGTVDEAVQEGYALLKEAGYEPYYMYRQKDTGHGLENTGFALPGKECSYNVAMMTDGRDVISFGAGGVSKRIFEQVGVTKYRVERCSCIRDVIGYINRWEEMSEKKIEFFEFGTTRR